MGALLKNAHGIDKMLWNEIAEVRIFRYVTKRTDVSALQPSSGFLRKSKHLRNLTVAVSSEVKGCYQVER